MALPHVLILYTGGTFGMEIQPGEKSKPGKLGVSKISPAFLKKRFHDQVPELKFLAQCDVDIILNRDSSHIGPAEWVFIAQKIRHSWKNYQGIVLLHGTDTLAYTASALSFLLHPCLKPVVITGAQRPLSALRTDARTNLISAVEIAAHGPRRIVNQITVLFGNQLFQGNRVRKRSAADFSAFETPHCPPLAVVGTTIRYSKTITEPSKKQRLLPLFSPKVLMCHITPGFPSAQLTQHLLPHLDGMVLIVFHSGTAPTHDPAFLNFLLEAKQRHIPVTLATESSVQNPNPVSSPLNYLVSQELLSHGGLWAGSMTPECTFVKTSLILGQSLDCRKDPKKFAALWKLNFANEGIH